MIAFPKSTTFSYIGSFPELPKNAKDGELVLFKDEVYGYMNNEWVPLYSSFKKTSSMIFELLEFLKEYEDSSLKQDILDLIESYRMCGYE